MNTARCFKAVLLAGGAGIAAFSAAPAFAQDDGASEDRAPIVVTGSRIVRRDFQSNSPIMTVSDDVLKSSSTTSIESNLNRLPQFTPDKTADAGSDIQPTATNTPGSATVALRNLGSNRSLVLIDGRRATPGNASMVVDINTIPSAAIDRVEIITGGASSTYGADAVGGVVNFIMKKDYQGLTLDAQTGISEHGDGFEYTVSGLVGANFDDGRGNITLSLSYNKREQALRRDRQWFNDFWQDPTTPQEEFFPAFSAVQAGFAAPFSQAAVDSIFGAANAVSTTDRYYVNADGTPFTGFFQSASPGGFSAFNGDTSGPKWNATENSTGDQLGWKQNFTDALLTLPLERYNMYSRANYEINDWVGVFAQGMFSKVSSHTLNQPSPSVNGWAAFIPNDGRALPTDIQNLLDSRQTILVPGVGAPGDDDYVAEVRDVVGSGAANPYQLTYYLDYQNREADVNVYTYNILAGLEGTIPNTDWTWELYASNGQSETTSYTTGTVSLERFRAIVSAPNWGEGFSQKGNPAFGGFGASSATCTSGINPFDLDQVLSEDCIAAIAAPLSTRSVMNQSVWEFNAQGGLFELPAGTVRAAVGASRRENSYNFYNDTLTTQGTSFLDQTIGIYPSGNSEGSIIVKELYGELLVPILEDSFIKRFELELGARYSDYNTTGSTWTFKALGDLQINDWLRFRGGFNRSVRAPNVAELYLAPQQTFVFSGGGDPCSINNELPYSANPATNADAAKVKAMCVTLMDKNDGPTQNTSGTFYGSPLFQTVGGTFAFPTLAGNSTVKPETADTWTAGMVINSPFVGALNNLRLAVDYYNIKVKDAIGAQSIDSAQQQCFDPTYNPTYDVTSPFCAGINRVTGDGAIGNIITTYFNNGRFQTSGIDVQLDWAIDAGPGRLSLNSAFNYLIELKSADLPGNPLREYAGTLGPSQNGLNPGSYRWKLNNTVGYSIGPATISLLWRHLPAIKSATFPVNPATTALGTGAYDIFNLFGSIAVMDNVNIRMGVDNLFNKRPPVLEVNPAAPSFLQPGGTFSSSSNSYFYDLTGRRFFAGVTVDF